MRTSEGHIVHREHRWMETEKEAEVLKFRRDGGLPPHVRPFSTLVAAMGPHWRPGCSEAVYEMCQFTYDQGYAVTFYEQPDLCHQSHDALGTMRNEIWTKAASEGFEWVCYVDNDVLPPKDALVKLLHRWVPVIVPRIEYADGESHGLDGPLTEPNKGLSVVASTVISMLLMDVATLSRWEGSFWADAIGAHEGFHFNKLRKGTGNRLFFDSDVTVKVLEPPHFPLDNRPKDGPVPLKDPADYHKPRLYVP